MMFLFARSHVCVSYLYLMARMTDELESYVRAAQTHPRCELNTYVAVASKHKLTSVRYVGTLAHSNYHPRTISIVDSDE